MLGKISRRLFHRPGAQSHHRAMVGRRPLRACECLDSGRRRVERTDGRPADLYRDWPLEFATLGFAIVADMLANPTRYDGQALADPFEGVDYGRTTAKFYINGQDGKPHINSHAHGGCKYFLKATAGPEPHPPEPPFDPEYYAQHAPLDADGGTRVPAFAAALPRPPDPPGVDNAPPAGRRAETTTAEAGGGEGAEPGRVGKRLHRLPTRKPA